MAVKQEQEEARSEVVEVARGVLRMQLPIQMPGLGHVNMYCLLDGEGAAVVDPGLPGDASWEAVVDRLRRADLQVRHVHTVLITHSHPDHFGGAARFAAETGCKVIAHANFTAFGLRPRVPHLEVSVEHLAGAEPEGERPGPEPVPPSDGPIEVTPPWQRGRTPWGSEPQPPTPEQRERWERMRSSPSFMVAPRLSHVVRDGAVLRLAGREFFVCHTPGHTADHLCLHDPDEGVLLAGDHVLPSITPHISGLGDAPDPLQAFFDSLDRAAELPDVRRCLPAHGHPFDDLPGRVQAIKLHHKERLAKLQAISKRLGPATVRELSEQLFHPRNWGNMAESETYAHLEHLRLRGQAERHSREDGLLVYEA